jgi:adenosylmethionine---8-amino-7-oxononanoate aminotransferase
VSGADGGGLGARARIVDADKRHLWHPYTPMDEYVAHGDPLVVARAEGARFWDADGRSYLDGNASWWVAALGHNHPRLVAALKRQADLLCHVSLAGVTHEGAALLAEEFVAICPPGLSRVFLSDNGSTAVEVAVKLAAQYWAQSGRPERKRFVSLEGAFHGETVGASSLGGVEVFRRPFAGLLFDCIHVPSPGELAAGVAVADQAGRLGALEAAAYGAAFEALARAVAGGAGTIAAVVLEPLVQGASGMRIYPPAYLRAARALCDEHDVFLVLDEVFTGYGRTGTFWACEQAGVSPDLLCAAKGFSGGMLPMGITAATERIFGGFLGGRERAFFYGHSFCGNPLGAAVAREVLRVFREERVLEGIAERAARIARAFAELGSLGGVEHPRSLGMIGALDVRPRPGDALVFDPEAHTGYLAGGGWRVFDEARRRGAYLRPLGDTVYVAPPVNIPLDDLDELLGILQQSVRAVAS